MEIVKSIARFLAKHNWKPNKDTFGMWSFRITRPDGRYRDHSVVGNYGYARNAALRFAERNKACKVELLP